MPSPFEIQLTLAPPRVLGRRLSVFTLGHGRLLEVSKSPFMLGGKIDSGDMILAAWLLTYPRFADARRACAAALAGRIPRWVSRWGRKIGLAFDFETETKALAEYVNACTKPPRMARREGSKSLATPTAATLAVLHRHYFHTVEKEIWDIPFLDAMLDVITFHHAQGMVDIISDRQAEFQQKIAAWKKRKAAP